MAEVIDPRKVKQDMLKVTKTDKSVHFMPYSAATNAFLIHQNARVLTDAAKWKVERLKISQEEMEATPFIDDSHVTASEAPARLAELEAEIAALRAQNQSLQNSGKSAVNTTSKDPASSSIKTPAEPPVGSNETTEQYNERIRKEKEDAEKAKNEGDKAPNAEVVIAQIKEAKSVEEVEALASNDTRKTVLTAAADKIKQLTA